MKGKQLLDDRPKIIITSTSWTPDEDMEILLKAAVEINLYSLKNNFPKLIVLITGKGPMKEFYEEKINDMNLENVQILTLWLEADDYPVLLKLCDLGISLHKSSSKLDLPMKIVDMFGAGIPVCAFGYECLSELVRDNRNGRIFHDSIELKDQIIVNYF